MLLVLAFLAILLSGTAIRNVTTGIHEQLRIERSRNQAIRRSTALGDASDYLTSEVWRFSTSLDPVHLRNYWNEVENARNRDNALSGLTALDLTQEEQALLKKAKEDSDALIGTETLAMRLIAESIGLNEAGMPAQVAAVRLPEAEKSLSPDGKLDRAAQYLRGGRYAESKRNIKEAVMEFRKRVHTRKNAELITIERRTQATMDMALVYVLGLELLLLIADGLFYTLNSRHFRAYARSLRRLDGDGFVPLTPQGSRETRAFAKAFNQVYAAWISQKQRLENEQFRFHVAVENTSSIVYEYDPATDLYWGYGTLEDGDPRERKNLERVIPRYLRTRVASLVEHGDLDRVIELLRSPTSGEIDMRVRMTPDAPFVWVRITSTPIPDEAGNILKVIGKIAKIEKEKAKEFALEEAKSRDALTGLWNREAGVRRVREALSNKAAGEIHCMMLLDMDDFFRLNTGEGRVFADAVLQETANILRSETGPGDILIRLGGDEFMLYILDCTKGRAVEIGPRIAARIRDLAHAASPDMRVSASIGMCVTTVVDEYSGLYRCAESTLRYVKAHGKDAAACYMDTSNELGAMLVDVYPERHSINAIDHTGEPAEENLISFALELLGKSKNLDDAVFLLLSRVGRSCGLDRVSILELDRDYLTCRCTYQWVRDPADTLMDQTRYVTAELARTLSGLYDKDRLYQGPRVSGIPSLSSCLHAGIWNRGLYVGSMSFERHAPDAVWTAEQRGLLAELSRVLASFILKAKADAVSQAKSAFLSRMSHEIRTPMNAVTGMTAIAKTVLDDRKRTLDCLEKIESANAYLLSLINDVLDMSRIESGKMELNLEPTDLGQQMDKLEALLRPQAEARKLSFTVENGFSGPLVMADVLRLSQVLVNIVGYAIKFTGEGGDVAVRLEPLADGAAPAAEARFRFSVADTGIGIAEEAVGRIFNAFEQENSVTSATYGGTGLGLTISSRLVQMMGGTLDVRSVPGEGSEFSFALAFPFAPESAGTGKPAPAPALNLRGGRILLAEDNPLNLEIAEAILTMNGFTVESAADGREALDAFTAHAPGHYDAILMDIRMPVMDGLEATRRIRTLDRPDSRTIPIIAMTANAFSEDMKKSLESGMNRHLSKPIEVDELLEALSGCIAEQAARGNAAAAGAASPTGGNGPGPAAPPPGGENAARAGGEPPFPAADCRTREKPLTQRASGRIGKATRGRHYARRGSRHLQTHRRSHDRERIERGTGEPRRRNGSRHPRRGRGIARFHRGRHDRSGNRRRGRGRQHGGNRGLHRPRRH